MHTVYLVHFDRFIPGGKNRHYIGTARNLEKRIADHRMGFSGPIFRLARDWRIGFEVARIWEFNDTQEAFDMERWLKEMRNAPKYCPCCTTSPWRTSDAHIGACERYAERLKRERYAQQYYRELRLGGLDHQAARDISRGRERA